MQKISERLHKEGLEKMKPFIEQLVHEGMDQNKIVSACKAYTQSKINSYYSMVRQPGKFGKILDSVTLDLQKRDSTAEAVFYHLLNQYEIPFKFQYKISYMHVDYLVSDYLVVEIDGPQHDKERDKRRDKLLRKLGYKVLRVPIFILALDVEAVLREIKTEITKEATK